MMTTAMVLLVGMVVRAMDLGVDRGDVERDKVSMGLLQVDGCRAVLSVGLSRITTSYESSSLPGTAGFRV